MNIRLMFCMFLLPILLMPMAHADEAGLSLAQAQQIAVGRSRQLAAQELAVSANHELAAAAAELPDPVLKMGVDNLPIEGGDAFTLGRDFMTMRRIGVMQEFTRSEKRELRAKLYEDEAEKNLAEKSVSAAAIQRDTALAWIDRYYAETDAAVIDAQLSAARLEVQAAEAEYRAGRGSQADVFAAHLALANLEDRMSHARLRASNTVVSLSRWIGAEEAAKPLAGKPEFETLHLDTGALDATLAHHPRIAVLAKQEQIAETEVQLARANKEADWSVEVAYAKRGPDFGDMVSVGVSVPLQWDQRHRQDREVAAKMAMVEQVRAEREEMLREHTTEIANLAAEWRNGHERLDRYQKEIVPLAAERTRALAAAYQGGKAGLSELLAARRSEIETREQALQLEMETARRWAQLDFLVPPSTQGVALAHHSKKESQ